LCDHPASQTHNHPGERQDLNQSGVTSGHLRQPHFSSGLRRLGLGSSKT
jgi:hypothetical protein